MSTRSKGTRLSLVNALSTRIEPNTGQSQTIMKHIDRALKEMVLTTPLAAVKELDAEDMEHMNLMIEVLNDGDAAQLSRKWEPERVIDRANQDTIRRDLIDVANGRRPVYTPPGRVNVAGLSPEERQHLVATVERLAPKSDLVKLHRQLLPGQPPPSDVGALRRGLLDVVRSSAAPEPAPEPAPAPVRGRRRRAEPAEAPVTAEHHAWQRRAYAEKTDDFKAAISLQEYGEMLRRNLDSARNLAEEVAALARSRGLVQKRGKWVKATPSEPAEAPAAHVRVYEPVKGKPHRRKYRDTKGAWQYEDVPLQKAGERKAEYLLRLMRFHLGEM